MSGGVLDLSRLPPPEVFGALDFEAVLSERTGRLADLFAAAGLYPRLDLETEPSVILQQSDAYRELLVRSEANSMVRSLLLAYAAGADLDHLAVTFHGLARMTGEDDDRFRRRVALEAQNKGGGRLAGYEAEALGASIEVLDASAWVDRSGPHPVVRVAIVDRSEAAVPELSLVHAVARHLNSDRVRQATDVVEVQPVRLVPVPIRATLHHLRGPDPAVLAREARASLARVLAARRTPGRDLPRSAILAALSVESVERVALAEPAVDLRVGPDGLIAPDAIRIGLELTDG